MVHFDYGYLTPPIWEYSPLPVDGSIWTFLFNLFVNIILTAIISGIIIDVKIFSFFKIIHFIITLFKINRLSEKEENSKN